jgi:putative phosphoribosyl transferase
MTSALVAVRELHIPFRHDVFRVELGVPRSSGGIVFLLRDNGNVVHGDALAFVLRENGFGTAICDLLTEPERERAATHRRIPVCTELLARRLLAVVDAVGDETDLGASAAGIAVSGTAAAAALRVAALRPLAFDAVACRHAKIDSVRSLEYVRAATLFLAVAGDLSRIRPMTRAFQQLQCGKRFEILPGGSPAFDDERSFRLATELTSTWMRKHVGRTVTAVPPRPAPSTDARSAVNAIPA